MHILFAGGGTAGHINPALAVAGYITKKYPDTKISYVGTANKLEAQLVPQAGYDFYSVDVAGFQRKISFKALKRNISAARKAVTASYASKKLLKQLKPDLVFGTGGYVSGPVLRQAAKMGIKTAVHEANAYPGVTIKLLAPVVDAVMLAYPEAKKHLNCKNSPIITGNPIRSEILHTDRKAAKEKLGVDDGKPMLLSFGGSLGAAALNRAAVGLIKENDGRYHHFHGTGKSGYKTTLSALKSEGIPSNSETVHISEYINNMDEMLAAADLVVCRAGAMTLSEITACGKPAIIIPSPYVAENHQFHNAMSLKSHGAAEIIEEKDLTAETLKSAVYDLIFDEDRLKTMSSNSYDLAITDANERILKVIEQLLSL